MGYNNFVTIKDISTGSSLWGGEEVYMMITDFGISSGNVLSPRPKTFQEPTLTTADTTAGDSSTSYKSNYNRRKSNVSYTGFNNNTITINCIYSDSKLGNTVSLSGTTRKIFNPSKLFELLLKPRTIYIKDQTIIPLLQSPQDTSPKVFGTNGIPCILKDWNITPSIEDGEVNIDLTFIEDKGSIV